MCTRVHCELKSADVTCALFILLINRFSHSTLTYIPDLRLITQHLRDKYTEITVFDDQDAVITQTLSSLHKESLEIKLTVPLCYTF